MGVPFSWIKNRDSRPRREDQTRYRALVDHSPEAVLVVCDGKIVFVNPQRSSCSPPPRQKICLGAHRASWFIPTSARKWNGGPKEAINGQRATTTERRMMRLDDTEVEVESRVIPFVFEGKSAVQVILREITARRAAERALPRNRGTGQRRSRFAP